MYRNCATRSRYKKNVTRITETARFEPAQARQVATLYYRSQVHPSTSISLPKLEDLYRNAEEQFSGHLVVEYDSQAFGHEVQKSDERARILREQMDTHPRIGYPAPSFSRQNVAGIKAAEIVREHLLTHILRADRAARASIFGMSLYSLQAARGRVSPVPL